MKLAKIYTCSNRFLRLGGRSVPDEDMQLFDDLLGQLISPGKESGRMRGGDHVVLVRSAGVRFPCPSSIPVGEARFNIIRDIFCLSCLFVSHKELVPSHELAHLQTKVMQFS